VHESGYDAVDDSSTGTRVSGIWVLFLFSKFVQCMGPFMAHSSFQPCRSATFESALKGTAAATRSDTLRPPNAALRSVAIRLKSGSRRSVLETSNMPLKRS
jgi:hypothetical protein